MNIGSIGNEDQIEYTIKNCDSKLRAHDPNLKFGGGIQGSGDTKVQLDASKRNNPDIIRETREFHLVCY